MLDVQFIRDNPELVAEKSRQKGYEVDVNKLLKLDAERRDLLQKIEELRRKRNEHAANLKKAKPSKQQLTEGRHLKAELTELETKITVVEEKLTALISAVPNMPLVDVPVGLTEDENIIAKTVGEKIDYGFKPKTHWELAVARDWIDKERAAKISGSRFAYIKGELALLQFATIQFVLTVLTDEKVIEKLIKENNLNLIVKPFVMVLPPAMLRTEPYEASARLNAEEVTYKLADDDLWLNASAEHTLCTMYWNEFLPKEQLPIRYLGYSTSFRREAGTYGKDTEGIIRMHQFDKLEMEVFSTAETGLDEHKLLIAVQEYLVQQLGLSYQFIQKCTADIGKPNASGFDINCWFSGQDRYIETHTADYMTDYQARSLKTRYRTKNGEVKLVHTNDATAFALGRIMAAIIENYQTVDGRVKVPAVLQPYMAGRTEL